MMTFQILRPTVLVALFLGLQISTSDEEGSLIQVVSGSTEFLAFGD